MLAYEIETIPRLDDEHRITHVKSDSRVATCYDLENARLVVKALNHLDPLGVMYPTPRCAERSPVEKVAEEHRPPRVRHFPRSTARCSSCGGFLCFPYPVRCGNPGAHQN